MVPNPGVQQQGLGAITADQANTYTQAVSSLAQLRSFSGVGQMLVTLEGYSAVGDGGQGWFVWSASSTGPDDSVNVIVPTGNSQGAWVRLPSNGASGPTGPAGAQGPPGPPGPSGTGITPYAAQMTLSSFNYTWVGQIDALTYWPPWDLLTDSTSGKAFAFNPDNMASLSVPVLPAASPPGPTWPGFVIPVDGYYQVYANINIQCLGGGPFNPAIFNTFITTVPFLFPTGAQTLFSDASFSNFAIGAAFANCNLQGTIKCLAGDAVFVGIDDANSFGAQNNVAITNGSYFGIFRVR